MFVSQKQHNEVITTKHPSLEADKEFHISCLLLCEPSIPWAQIAPTTAHVTPAFFFLLHLFIIFSAIEKSDQNQYENVLH